MAAGELKGWLVCGYGRRQLVRGFRHCQGWLCGSSWTWLVPAAFDPVGSPRIHHVIEGVERLVCGYGRRKLVRCRSGSCAVHGGPGSSPRSGVGTLGANGS
jgi:hypothetical protein